MQTKILEIRDRATFIPVMVTKMKSDSERGTKLLRVKGFSGSATELVHMTRLDGKGSDCDPYEWGDRTLHTAHLHIEKHFDKLVEGDVIDVEFILGETSTKKAPQ